jgi:acyl carrier protein
MQREAIRDLVFTSFTDALNGRSEEVPADFEVAESTPLIGHESLLDSLGLVQLIVDLEQRVEEASGVIITIADDRAMSQRNSPFRTAGTLTDYIYLLTEEQRSNVAA